MNLKRIELTNYRQHRSLDIDFSGNLIAVLGPNGSGKSNLIGAIQFALTGEQPGFTKADLTTWGEKEGSVRLFFTAGPKNEEFCITRKTNGDVVLKVGGETIKQARKVEDALREKAGLDKELIRQIVFVPQKGIDAILFDDPKNREVAFQRLIGIGNASKIYEALRTEIAAYDKPQGFDEALARARQQLEEQSGIAKTCREALENYEAALKMLPTKEELEQKANRLTGAQMCAEEYATVCSDLEASQRSSETAMKAMAESGSVSEADEDELRKKVDEQKDELRFLVRLGELSDACVSANTECEKASRDAEAVMSAYKSDLESQRAEVKRLDAEQAAAEAEERSLGGMMREASSDGTCPLCGAPATQEDIQKHVGEKLKVIKARRKEITDKAGKARMALDKREAEQSMAARNVEKARARMESARSALQSAKDKGVEGVEIDMGTFSASYRGHSPSEVGDISAELAENERKLRDAIDKKTASKNLRDTVARLSTQIDLLMKKKLDLEKRLVGMEIDPETVGEDSAEAMREATKKAKDNLDSYNGILCDMAAEKGKLESTEETIAKTRIFIDDLESKKELEDRLKAKVDALKRSRDWFHYREGPRIMSQNVMKELTACVNSYLDQFCAPFVVDAEEEGFGFRCRFIDGRTMPDPHPDASLLSGGQKVALAIAFRMAIYMCFGCELGLLSLDEPTAYLDDASIEHLGELLQKVGEVARNKGLQILMATHEKAIMPFLDTKIDLGAIKETMKED